jgi:Lrp/AsnC family leucine-responsive transcriptional regulator
MTEAPLQLDTKAWALLMALQADGRAPLKTLALAAGLSVPATMERLKRLMEAGVVTSVGAELDPPRAGGSGLATVSRQTSSCRRSR